MKIMRLNLTAIMQVTILIQVKAMQQMPVQTAVMRPGQEHQKDLLRPGLREHRQHRGHLQAAAHQMMRRAVLLPDLLQHCLRQEVLLLK